MKKIGFGGWAVATTLKGEVTLAPAVGLDTVSGKSFDPAPHAAAEGSSAVGAGNLVLLADQVIGTAGVDGNEGDGAGVGVGIGVGVVVDVLELDPQPASTRIIATRTETPHNVRLLRAICKLETAHINDLRTE